MDIRFENQYNPELDCLLLFYHRFAKERTESAVGELLDMLVQSRGLPVEELRLITAPAAALERHIMEGMTAPEQLLRYYFPPTCEQNGNIGLSFWKLRRHGIRFRDLPQDELEKHKCNLLRDVAGLSAEQIGRIADITGLLSQLDENDCSDHTLRVCLDIYRNPIASQENYDRIMDEAVELYRQKEGLLPEPGRYSQGFLQRIHQTADNIFQGICGKMPQEVTCYCYPAAFHFAGHMILVDDLYKPVPDILVPVGAFDDKIEELQIKHNSVVPDLTIKLKAMSDQRRMEILGELSHGPRRVDDLTSQFAMSPALLSYHLDQLYRVNLVNVERQGRVNLYQLNYLALRQILQTLTQYLLSSDTGDVEIL